MPGLSLVITSRAIRTDIQALRTIAVSLVVLFHLWPNRIAGGFIGVDVFFVISGFLITRHILQEVDSGRFSVTGFWARRIKRLLPASFLVLLATGAGVALFAPVSQWAQWFGEIQSSVFYFENWNLAGASVDYLALSNQASPVQHFWSLSVEEQFYFFWPLLIALALAVAGTRKTSSFSQRKRIFLVLLAISVISFLLSIFYTGAEPAIAYFSTPVRAWEFGAGALTVFLPAIKSKSLKSWTALIGLFAILAAAFVIDTSTPFPGAAALLPVLGTVLVIYAAPETGRIGNLLAWRPIQWVGDKSYAIYLWHWPVIIFAPLILGTGLSAISKSIVIVITLLLSWLTHQFVEMPISRVQIPKWKIFALAATASVFIASIGGLAIQIGNQSIRAELMLGKAGAVAAQPCFGAAARVNPEACKTSSIKGVYPAPKVAAADIAELPETCFSVSRAQIDASYCALGNRDGSIKIAAIGDSHLAQYAGALNFLATKNNWKLDLYAKGGCPFSFAVRVHDEVLTKNCPAWVANVLAAIPAQKYDAIISSQRAGMEWNGGEATAVKGLTQLWMQLVAEGERLVVIKDQPNPGQNAVTCLLQQNDCSFNREAAFKFDAQVESAKKLPELEFVNFDDIFCDSQKCFPIIGNAIVYRDDNHLTDTFARTLAPYIEPYILRALAKQ
jgi:peptidoglycan/LPS O-acetylase OafA/YrhL